MRTSNSSFVSERPLDVSFGGFDFQSALIQSTSTDTFHSHILQSSNTNANTNIEADLVLRRGGGGIVSRRSVESPPRPSPHSVIVPPVRPFKSPPPSNPSTVRLEKSKNPSPSDLRSYGRTRSTPKQDSHLSETSSEQSLPLLSTSGTDSVSGDAKNTYVPNNTSAFDVPLVRSTSEHPLHRHGEESIGRRESDKENRDEDPDELKVTRSESENLENNNFTRHRSVGSRRDSSPVRRDDSHHLIERTPSTLSKTPRQQSTSLNEPHVGISQSHYFKSKEKLISPKADKRARASRQSIKVESMAATADDDSSVALSSLSSVPTVSTKSSLLLRRLGELESKYSALSNKVQGLERSPEKNERSAPIASQEKAFPPSSTIESTALTMDSILSKKSASIHRKLHISEQDRSAVPRRMEEESYYTREIDSDSNEITRGTRGDYHSLEVSNKKRLEIGDEDDDLSRPETRSRDLKADRDPMQRAPSHATSRKVADERRRLEEATRRRRERSSIDASFFFESGKRSLTPERKQSVFNSSKERHLKSAPYSLVADLAPSPEIVSIVRSIHNKLVMKTQKQIELDLLFKMNRLHAK